MPFLLAGDACVRAFHCVVLNIYLLELIAAELKANNE